MRRRCVKYDILYLKIFFSILPLSLGTFTVGGAVFFRVGRVLIFFVLGKSSFLFHRFPRFRATFRRHTFSHVSPGPDHVCFTIVTNARLILEAKQSAPERRGIRVPHRSGDLKTRPSGRTTGISTPPDQTQR